MNEMSQVHIAYSAHLAFSTAPSYKPLMEKTFWLFSPQSASWAYLDRGKYMEPSMKTAPDSRMYQQEAISPRL